MVPRETVSFVFLRLLFVSGNIRTRSRENKTSCIPREYTLRRGGNMKVVFWLGIMFLMQISCLRFKQSRISLLISHIYVLGCFVNFLVIFRYIWREIVFLKGLVKLIEIGNFEDLLSLKLKIGRYTPNSCPTTWGAIVRSGNCLVVFHNPFFPFQPLFKLTKISLKFTFTPP